ncbi:putative lipid II flippase FtsW [Bdellovibrionota bacterium FG-2]
MNKEKLKSLFRRLVPSEGPAPSPGSFDALLLVTVTLLVLFGLLMVYSSSFIFAQERTGDGFSFIKKQALFACIGFGALYLSYRVEYQKWEKWAYPFLGGALLLLIAVLIPGIGLKAGGAQRWLRLGPLSFQPGELAKFAVIFFVAKQLHAKKDRFNNFTAGFLAYFIVPLPTMILLLLQPDFGTTVMIGIVIFALMFLAGVPKKYWLSAIFLITAAGAILILKSPYRMTRVTTFLDPWSDPGGKGFQILQSLVGLHNGRFWGAGLGNGKEKLFYLPEAHNDFIFAVIGEELGFIGIAAVAGAYLYFTYRGLRIAWRSFFNYQDTFGMLLAAGITLALSVQGFINMAVVMGLLPTKGLTLPFVSYGGSALLVDLFSVGVLLNISKGPLRSIHAKSS